MSANSQSLSTRARNFAPARCYCFPFSLSASTFSVPSPQRLNLSPSLTPYASRFTPCLLSPQSWLPPESLASRVCRAFRKERNRRSDSIDAIDATDPKDASRFTPAVVCLSSNAFRLILHVRRNVYKLLRPQRNTPICFQRIEL